MTEQNQKVTIQTHIYRNFLYNTVFALIVISVISTLVYVGALFISEKMIVDVLIENSINNIDERILNEKVIMEVKLKEVERMLSSFQSDESEFFKTLNDRPFPETDLFRYHENGVFYKPKDNGGSSLYYSSDTVIGDYELKKAYYTESFDSKYKSFVDNNPLIGQIYINTYDNMNRLYPYMPNAPGQYGSTLKMTDYNFYYLADSNHNPSGHPVWTKAYLDPAGMGWMVSCIVPIYNDGFLEGVTGADLTIDLLINHFMNLDIKPASGILVTDASGGIIAMNKDVQELFKLEELTGHTYTSTIDETIYKPEEYSISNLKTNDQLPFVDMLEHGNRHQTFELNNKTFHIERTSLDTTGWQLFVIIDEESIINEINDVNDIIWRILLYELLIIALMIFVYYLGFKKRARKVSKNISTPFEELSLAVNMFGKEPIDISGKNLSPIHEINELYEHFGEMLDELEARTQALIREETEKKVQAQLALKYKAEANIDTLTGLHNRRWIDDQLNEELKRSHEYQSTIALILIDIDNFKRINDEFGHLTGDNVLKAFADLVKSTIRDTDESGRWGGEEFLIICPYSTASEAFILAEKLRNKVCEHDFGLNRQVTASFGVAEYRDDDDRRRLFERVDMAMYQAKGMSKNVVVNAEDN